MTKKVPELSIFFPFWNEQENIESVVKSAIPIAKDLAEKWEIIIVDDGSTDSTASIAKRLAKDNTNVFLVSNKTNRGYGAALKSGFEVAKFELIVFTDGDNQFDFSQTTRFLEKIHDSDL